MSAQNKGDGTDLLLTSEHSFIKSHAVYDGSNRLTDLFEVWAGAPNNTPCIHTRYKYLSPTSSIITDTIEQSDVWDSTWDF